MERHRPRPRSVSIDCGFKRKRPPPVNECEQLQSDSMTTSEEFQRYYYSSTSDCSDSMTTSEEFQRYYYSSTSDCSDDSDGSHVFEADHGYSVDENAGPSPTPDMDWGRPFQGDWHLSLGPAFPPNLQSIQPSETGRGPQWRSAFMGRTCVQPEHPFIFEQGGNYRMDFPGQSPYNRRVPLQGSNDSSTNAQFWRPWCSNERSVRSTTWPHMNESERGPYSYQESCHEAPYNRRVPLQGSNDSSTNAQFWRPWCSNERSVRSTTWPHMNESERGPYSYQESCHEAPYNRRVPLQGSNDSSTNAQFWRPWCSNERGVRSTTWPHMYESERGPYSYQESCHERQRRRWYKRREGRISPRHVERAVSSEKDRDQSGRRRKHTTHNSPWIDAACYEPRYSQRRPYRTEMEDRPERRCECGTRRRSRSETTRCTEPSKRRRSDSGSRWRIESRATPHNESGYRLHTSMDLPKRDRRVVDASAPCGAVKQVRSRTRTLVHAGSRSWAHLQEPENSETTERCASAQLRMRGQCHCTLAPVRAELSARVVKRDLFCDASLNQNSDREQIKPVPFQEKREEHVLSHKPSRHLASETTRRGQGVASDREIAQAEVQGEPELTFGGTQMLEDARLSSENRLQEYSLGSGAHGTVVASPVSDRSLHGGTTSRLNKEESTLPIRQPDTAVFVDVVNAAINLAPEDFRECHSGALVQPSSYNHDAYVEVHHASGDSEHKVMVASYSVDDEKPIRMEGKAVTTIADTDAERTSNSGREAPFLNPLDTIIAPAKDIKTMVSDWLQSFPAQDSVSSMLVCDERQTTHASDRIAETPEKPCTSADAAPTKELSFWERDTESMPSTDAPAVEPNFWERETESMPSTASGDDGSVIVVSEHFPSRHITPQHCGAARVADFTR
ncbi:hypothetical protein V5799_030801 [Amblyomma americanum]|uniref:Uncharacterized protein n=1 Tax=Amblyomma americanum TaxID=6943 RepID=A0AAQ4EMA9_AMBAM